jgi:hypothetical protein
MSTVVPPGSAGEPARRAALPGLMGIDVLGVGARTHAVLSGHDRPGPAR